MYPVWEDVTSGPRGRGDALPWPARHDTGRIEGMRCAECGAEYVQVVIPQRCPKCAQRLPGQSIAPLPLTEWILKKTSRQIATQAAVEAARRRIHGD